MDLISELESEFDSLTENQKVDRILLRVGSETHLLRHPEIGKDYVAGIGNRQVFVFPTSSISELIGSAIPEIESTSLEEFLVRQRRPIRVRFSVAGEAANGWLLNIQTGWLRVSSSKSVSWIPLATITHLEITAVDN